MVKNLYSDGLRQAKHTNLYSDGLRQAKHTNLYSDGLRQAKHTNLLHEPNRMMVHGKIIAVYCGVKVAFSLEQVLKAQMWSRVMALLFL